MISINNQKGKATYVFQGNTEEQKTETAIAMASYMNSVYEETGNLPNVIEELDDIILAATEQFCVMQDISPTVFLAVLSLTHTADLTQDILPGGFLS